MSSRAHAKQGGDAPRKARRHLHPFPARMAPDLAVAALESLRATATVLDPMCGSGTVLHEAARRGYATIGFDVDPLAVLLARVATSRLRGDTVRRAFDDVVDRADAIGDVMPTWIAADVETLAFTEYWFGEQQACVLRSVASALAERVGPASDALRVALSRTIITKDHGASLARDVSHSRPHRVANTNAFDVRSRFRAAASSVATWLDENKVTARARVGRGDARRLPPALARSVDLVITSPPYLNAIDYLRGHRLALVWLGHQIPELRGIRSGSVGTERGLIDPSPTVKRVARAAGAMRELPDRERNILFRYVADLVGVAKEIERVLRPGGRAVLVVGNSNLRGVFVSNAGALKAAASEAGLVVVHERERDLPSQHRYLPPPSHTGSSLERRMHTETVLTLQKSRTRATRPRGVPSARTN